MTIPILITFAIIILAIVLFVREQFSIDTTSILVMSLFIATGVLTPPEGFAGFNHSATITVGCMFVISTAIFKTGALKRISLLLTRLGQKNYTLCLLSIMGTTAVFSAFINDYRGGSLADAYGIAGGQVIQDKPEPPADAPSPLARSWAGCAPSLAPLPTFW